MTGRGLAYTERTGTIVAAIAEVEVDRSERTRVGEEILGRPRLRPDHQSRAHCKLTIEGNVVQAVSRTLFEEVRFDEDRVMSVDWASYPILDIADAPEAIEIVLIDRPRWRRRAPESRRRARYRRRSRTPSSMPRACACGAYRLRPSG